MQAVLGWIADMTDAPGDDARSIACRAMDRYAAGEDAAFEIVYAELEGALLGFARRRAAGAAAAEDAVQQTFLQMIGCRAGWVRGAAVRPWAYAILRRLLIDAARRGRSAGGPEAEAALRDGGPAAGTGRTGEEALDDRRALAEVLADLASLPERYRGAFELVRLEGLPVAEAAEVLGITAGNVKVRVHRAAEQLRLRRSEREGRATARPFTESEIPSDEPL